MRAQDLHSAFLFHRPTHCLLKLFANVTKVKCGIGLPISLRWTLYDKLRRSHGNFR